MYNSDEEAAKLAQQGDNDALEYLMKKYHGLLVRISMRCRNVNMELEDLVQEGRIGLYKAIMTYSDKVDCSFKTFFYLCAKRKLFSAIKMYTRQKHKPLNQYIPLKHELEDMGLEIVDTRVRPEDVVEMKELISIIHAVIEKELSWLEADAIKLKLNGYKYKEIAKRLKLGENRVRKALERGKYKLRKHLRGRYYEYT